MTARRYGVVASDGCAVSPPLPSRRYCPEDHPDIEGSAGLAQQPIVQVDRGLQPARFGGEFC
jgi:hypothetical protein